MRNKYLWILLVATGLFSCKKENGPTNPPAGQPPAQPPGALLKEIVIPNLPSPYYHFDYNSDGKLTSTSFASGYEVSNIIYGGDRITEVRDVLPPNSDKLKFLYNIEGKVNVINYIDPSNVVQTRVVLDYTGEKLVDLERQVWTGISFITDKTMHFSYDAAGNLFELKYHYTIPGTPEATYSDRFEDYDDKVNVDGFGLLHNEFFDHLFILPGVQLQKNNPGKETRTGDAQNYVVTYTYTYNSTNQPLSKTGDLVFTTGNNVGQHFTTNAAYSYY